MASVVCACVFVTKTDTWLYPLMEAFVSSLASDVFCSYNTGIQFAALPLKTTRLQLDGWCQMCSIIT